jgi:hypothetical protein
MAYLYKPSGGAWSGSLVANNKTTHYMDGSVDSMGVQYALGADYSDFCLLFAEKSNAMSSWATTKLMVSNDYPYYYGYLALDVDRTGNVYIAADNTQNELVFIYRSKE